MAKKIRNFIVATLILALVPSAGFCSANAALSALAAILSKIPNKGCSASNNFLANKFRVANSNLISEGKNGIVGFYVNDNNQVCSNGSVANASHKNLMFLWDSEISGSTVIDRSENGVTGIVVNTNRGG